jgi:hypothetical protein
MNIKQACILLRNMHSNRTECIVILAEFASNEFFLSIREKKRNFYLDFVQTINSIIFHIYIRYGVFFLKKI